MTDTSSNPTPISPQARPRGRTFVQWLQDPLGSVVASSVAIIGSFGFVLSGTWFIHLALN